MAVIPMDVNLRCVSSDDLMSYESMRRERDLTWDDVDWDGDGIELLNGPFSEDRDTYIKIVNSNPTYRELFRIQRRVDHFYCDVEFFSDDGYILAHRVFLRGHSAFLDSLLNSTGSSQEKDKVSVSLPNVKTHTVKLFVSLLYNGQVYVNRAEEESVKELMRTLQIDIDKFHCQLPPGDPNNPQRRKNKLVRGYRLPDPDNNGRAETIASELATPNPSSSPVRMRTVPPPPEEPNVSLTSSVSVPAPSLSEVSGTTAVLPQPGSSSSGHPQPGSSSSGHPQPGSSSSGHAQPGSSSSLTQNNYGLPEIKKVPPGTLLGIGKTQAQRIKRPAAPENQQTSEDPAPATSAESSNSINGECSQDASNESHPRRPSYLPPEIQKVPPGTCLKLNKQPRLIRPPAPEPEPVRKSARIKHRKASGHNTDSEDPNPKMPKSSYERDDDYVPDTAEIENVMEDNAIPDFLYDSEEEYPRRPKTRHAVTENGSAQKRKSRRRSRGKSVPSQPAPNDAETENNSQNNKSPVPADAVPSTSTDNASQGTQPMARETAIPSTSTDNASQGTQPMTRGTAIPSTSTDNTSQGTKPMARRTGVPSTSTDNASQGTKPMGRRTRQRSKADKRNRGECAPNENGEDVLMSSNEICAFCNASFLYLLDLISHLEESCGKTLTGMYNLSKKDCRTCKTSFTNYSAVEFMEHVKMCVYGAPQRKGKSKGDKAQKQNDNSRSSTNSVDFGGCPTPLPSGSSESSNPPEAADVGGVNSEQIEPANLSASHFGYNFVQCSAVMDNLTDHEIAKIIHKIQTKKPYLVKRPLLPEGQIYVVESSKDEEELASRSLAEAIALADKLDEREKFAASSPRRKTPAKPKTGQKRVRGKSADKPGPASVKLKMQQAKKQRLERQGLENSSPEQGRARRSSVGSMETEVLPSSRSSTSSLLPPDEISTIISPRAQTTAEKLRSKLREKLLVVTRPPGEATKNSTEINKNKNGEPVMKLMESSKQLTGGQSITNSTSTPTDRTQNQKDPGAQEESSQQTGSASQSTTNCPGSTEPQRKRIPKPFSKTSAYKKLQAQAQSLAATDAAVKITNQAENESHGTINSSSNTSDNTLPSNNQANPTSADSQTEAGASSHSIITSITPSTALEESLTPVGVPAILGLKTKIIQQHKEVITGNTVKPSEQQTSAPASSSGTGSVTQQQQQQHKPQDAVSVSLPTETGDTPPVSATQYHSNQNEVGAVLIPVNDPSNTTTNSVLHSTALIITGTSTIQTESATSGSSSLASSTNNNIHTVIPMITYSNPQQIHRANPDSSAILPNTQTSSESSNFSPEVRSNDTSEPAAIISAAAAAAAAEALRPQPRLQNGMESRIEPQQRNSAIPRDNRMAEQLQQQVRQTLHPPVQQHQHVPHPLNQEAMHRFQQQRSQEQHNSTIAAIASSNTTGRTSGSQQVQQPNYQQSELTIRQVESLRPNLTEQQLSMHQRQQGQMQQHRQQLNISIAGFAHAYHNNIEMNSLGNYSHQNNQRMGPVTSASFLPQAHHQQQQQQHHESNRNVSHESLVTQQRSNTLPNRRHTDSLSFLSGNPRMSPGVTGGATMVRLPHINPLVPRGQPAPQFARRAPQMGNAQTAFQYSSGNITQSNAQQTMRGNAIHLQSGHNGNMNSALVNQPLYQPQNLMQVQQQGSAAPPNYYQNSSTGAASLGSAVPSTSGSEVKLKCKSCGCLFRSQEYQNHIEMGICD